MTQVFERVHPTSRPGHRRTRTEHQSSLEAAGYEGLYQLGQVKRYERGEIIFLEGDRLAHHYVILTGAVRIYKQNPDGKTVTLAIWPPPNTFGDNDLFGGHAVDVSASAITASTLLMVERNVFRAYVSEHPETYAILMLHVVDRLRLMEERLVDVAALSVEERLIKVLLALAAHFGPEIPFSHDDLADLSGGCRELISRCLFRLRESGVVDTRRMRIIILDENGLRRMVATTRSRRRGSRACGPKLRAAYPEGAGGITWN